MVLGEVERIDREAREVVLRSEMRVSYDVLVLATGATHSYFGHPEWERSAPGLKTIADARLIRSQILRCFEQAEVAQDEDERERLMTFAIVGGGPTGVELAGAIAELARYTLAKDFRNIRPERAKVLLIEAGGRLLTAFPEPLGSYAERRLTRLGVTVLLNSPVTPLSRDAIFVDRHALPVGVTIWAAGVAASPAANWIGAETDNAGRIPVAPDLSVPGMSAFTAPIGGATIGSVGGARTSQSSSATLHACSRRCSMWQNGWRAIGRMGMCGSNASRYTRKHMDRCTRLYTCANFSASGSTCVLVSLTTYQRRRR